MATLHPQNIRDFPTLLEYLRDELDWPFYESNWEDNAFDENPRDLGIDPQHAVKIKSLRRLRPSEESGPWGVFYLEFEAKRLPIVVLRRILRALVPKKRASANAAERRVWNCNDLLFICAGGEDSHRALTFAHFRGVESHHVAQLRTFGWDEREQNFYSLQNLNLQKLNWGHQDDWAHAFTAEHGATIRDSRELAIHLAHFARRTKNLALELLKLEDQNGKLHQLHRAFQKSLLAELKEEQFADTIAQTIAYGLFAGRATGRKLSSLGLADLGGMIPETNPFLRELFREFVEVSADFETHKVDFDDLGIVELVEWLNVVPMENVLADFGRQSGGGAQDPVIHFYETFLKEYDAKARIQRGVYYTPKPVVDFIVRGVDSLLRSELGCPLGLADSSKDADGNYRVCILDPATGTGTFLVAVIETIYATMCGEWKKQGKRDIEYSKLWNEYVSTSLLPRLHGFELMMASYTVAHLKIGLKLSELGYEPKRGERLRVFLTNTLEESQQLALDLPGFLSKEATEAQRVKNDTKITVIVGNPPYSISSSNTSNWIKELTAVYKAGLSETNINSLSDDYIKFLRFSEHYLTQVPAAVMGMVTNNSFLDGITHRRMRASLLKSFQKLFFIDLHGSVSVISQVPDETKDENVFEIQQGVGISLFVASTSEEPSQSFHFDCYGSRAEKYTFLNTNDAACLAYESLEMRPPNYFFKPKDFSLEEEYQTGCSTIEIFEVFSTGIKFRKDNLLVKHHFTADSVKMMLDDVQQLTPSELMLRYDFSETDDWQISEKKRYLDPERTQDIQAVTYRPFDTRFSYYPIDDVRHIIVRGDSRARLMQHMLLGENLAFITTRLNRQVSTGYFFVTRDLSDLHILDNARDSTQVFPLYLYNPPINHDTQLLGVGANGRRANLSPGFVAALGARLGLSWTSDGSGQRTPSVSDGLELGVSSHSDAKPVADAAGSLGTFGPEDVLCYIYAIFHTPSYRARYSEFLKIDFPRVPLTDDVDLFWKLVQCGRALVGLHLLDDDKTDAVNCVPTDSPQGEIAAGYPKFVDNRVLVNAQSGFDNVAESVWNFHIGGYQVAHKWLKDRRGRVLSDEDAAHYRRVLIALEQTIAQMQAIDAIVESHGGWPLRGSQDAAVLSAEEIKSFFAARDASEVDSRPVKTTQIVGTQISASADSNATTDAEICVPTRHRVLDNEESAPDVSETAPSTQQRVLDVDKNTADVPPHVPTQAIDDYTRDELIEALLNAMEKRIWHEREEVLVVAARGLGFARVGRRIRTAFASAFNGAIRRGLLEYDGTLVRQP